MIVESFGDAPESLMEKENFNKYCNATEMELYNFKDSNTLKSREQETLNTLPASTAAPLTVALET